MYQGNAYNRRAKANTQHAICGSLGLVAQRCVVPPILPVAPHPPGTAHFPPSASRCPKGRAAIRGLLLGRRRGYFASTTTCRASLVLPASEPPLFPFDFAFPLPSPVQGLLEEGNFSETPFAHRQGECGASLKSSFQQLSSILILGKLAGFAAQCKLSPSASSPPFSSPSSTARSWVLVFPCPVLLRSAFAICLRYRLSYCRRHRCLANSSPNCKCL